VSSPHDVIDVVIDGGKLKSPAGDLNYLPGPGL
jgi:hypothetical protein